MPPRPIVLTATHPLRCPDNLDACILSTAHEPRLAADHAAIVLRSFALPPTVTLVLDLVAESHGGSIGICMSLRIDLDASVLRIALGALEPSFDPRDEVEVAVKGCLGG